MQNVERPSSVYDYNFVGGKFNSYLFETIYDVSYEIKFKPTGYLFGDDSKYSDKTYEFVIEIADFSKNRKAPTDKLLPYTIAAIVDNFFSRNLQNIIVYVYDTADQKFDIRRRKFNSWFAFFKKDVYIKGEVPIYDPSQDVTYYNCILIRNDNPHWSDIFVEFNRIILGFEK